MRMAQAGKVQMILMVAIGAMPAGHTTFGINAVAAITERPLRRKQDTQPSRWPQKPDPNTPHPQATFRRMMGTQTSGLHIRFHP
jgi:hypothetical protein